MRSHHEATIKAVVDELKADPEVEAVLLGGSIAHGYEKDHSDVDIMIVVGNENYLKRKAERRLQYYNADISTYEGGYVDGKYIDREYLMKVADSGSDPSRYAFKDSHILFERAGDIRQILSRITAFPEDDSDDRISRFSAQLLAWKWYYEEGLKQENRYLQQLAVQKLILFGCRIVLAENRRLYPYHKWLLEEVRRSDNRPEGLLERIEVLLDAPDKEIVEGYCRMITEFYRIDTDAIRWPDLFMADSELNWMSGHTPIDDL